MNRLQSRQIVLGQICPADESLRGGVRPYALTDHIHEREAGFHLSGLRTQKDLTGDFSLAFVPAVAPWFQGIISTLSAPLKEEMRASDVRALYEEMYKDEKLVKIVSGVPEVADITGKHGPRGPSCCSVADWSGQNQRGNKIPAKVVKRG